MQIENWQGLPQKRRNYAMLSQMLIKFVHALLELPTDPESNEPVPHIRRYTKRDDFEKAIKKESEQKEKQSNRAFLIDLCFLGSAGEF